MSIKTLAARIWVFCAPANWGYGRSRLHAAWAARPGRGGLGVPHRHDLRVIFMEILTG